MAKKNVSCEELFADAEENAGRTTKKGIKVPREFAENLITKYDEMKVRFNLSVASVNEYLGLTHSNHRAGAIRKQLRKVHRDLLPDGKQWYVGTTAKDTMYVFAIEDAELEA